MKKTAGWKNVALNRIVPDGWIRLFLERQRDGLTGHLEVAGYPFDTKGWLHKALPLGERGGTGWWPYEQTAYWYDGMLRCGILLNDKFLKSKARRPLDHVMGYPDKDGYLGPETLKVLKSEHASERWPFTVFFRAVMADHDERPSRAVLQKMIRHYVSGTARHETSRNVCNIEIMAWLYEQTGDVRMRDMAVASYQAFQDKESKHGATVKNMASRKSPRDHGPTYMELFKLAAIIHRITGEKSLLDASINAVRKLHRDHVLIDGVPSTTEHLRGIYSTAGHETCVITDYLWSLGCLLSATGNAAYADTMERIAFNALPGAVTDDFKALQYFSGPNQVVAGPQTNHHPHGTAHAHISFRPNPGTECCPGNVHRAMPIFAGCMWMQDGDDGIVAALYGPGACTFGKGRDKIVVTETTDYPFSDDIIFRFQCPRPRKLRFILRIPGWCRKPELTINGKRVNRALPCGMFTELKRTFSDGDTINLRLPKELKSVRGPEDGVGIEWGPLVMSLAIKEHRVVEKDHRSTREFPAWTINPASPWNYGLSIKKAGKLPECRLDVRPVVDNPWDPAHTPVRLHVPARRIPGWKLIKKKKLVQKWGDKVRVHEGNIQFMPPLPGEAKRRKAVRREEWVELIPYGATNLRVTWFPRLDEP